MEETHTPELPLIYFNRENDNITVDTITGVKDRA